jgi:outer membrane lipoprotein carrier protein
LIVFRWLIFAAVSVAGLSADARSTVNQVISRVEKRYNAARTLIVDFREQYSIQGRPRPMEQGTLMLRKQGKMRWDYSHPAGKLFISDGKTVFLYTAGDNRVEKIPLKDTADMRVPLAFLLGRLDMRKEFRDFRAQPQGSGTLLTAQAKDDKAPYERVEMLISPDGAISNLRVAGRDGSLLEYRFSNEVLNPPLPETAFHFVIPPGAEVVKAIDYGSEGK